MPHKVNTISHLCCAICPLLDLDRLEELSPCGHHCFVILTLMTPPLSLRIYKFFYSSLLCKMEKSKPLATDSFSYSWLSNCRLPTNSTLLEECQNFNFDIPITQSPSAVVAHADELFSDGLIKPIFVDPSPVESCCNTPDSTKTKPTSSSFSPSPRTVEIHNHHGILTRWKSSACQTLRNLCRYVCQRIGCSRKCTKVDDIDKEEWQQVRRWSSLQRASPKSVTVHPIGALHDHHENSIYEAVLHCKRSIGINIMLILLCFYLNI